MSGSAKELGISVDRLRRVIATDCGSTTTKAVLFELTPDGWRQTSRGEAPTTVEEPVADVTIGVVNAFREVQELSGYTILRERADHNNPLIVRTDSASNDGVDLYVSTSSAGGGLQMIVAGVVASMTTESAERAALGAGAIVMDAISIDDGREPHERVQKIRHLRPDIILLAGGTDGGTVDHPLELAETILQADPRPRFGKTLRLPVIYAANQNAREDARKILESRFEFSAVANIRPTLEQENLKPARDAIHELFLHHVMSHAPGYHDLLTWTPIPILPTPAAFGNMVLIAADRLQKQILAVDIGGATTDVFSVFRGEDGTPVFNRTVSANLGMSYSIANVMLEAGEENIRRWLPFDISRDELRDRLRNKMIRPTSIPQTSEDLMLEQAVCREALRLAFHHHKRLAVGLRGTARKRTMADVFRQTTSSSLVNMRELDMILGSGGVLSHAPNRTSAALMMVDGYEPEGVTQLTVDSIFMMPHLGVFASVLPEAATEIFLKDCLVHLGNVVAPLGQFPADAELCEVSFAGESLGILTSGELRLVNLGKDTRGELVLTPSNGRVDIGSGPGKTHRVEIVGGEVGLLLDGRGRPLALPKDDATRKFTVKRWLTACGLGEN